MLKTIKNSKQNSETPVQPGKTKLLPAMVLLLIACIVFPMSSFAQDIIIKRNGEEIESKVLEVNSSDIKYKKSDNIDGPTYSIPKSEVFMVKYTNGTKDVFQNQVNETTATATVGATSKSSSKFINITQFGFAFGVGKHEMNYYDPYNTYPIFYEVSNDGKILNVTTINGVKVSDYFSAGVGLSLEYYVDNNYYGNALLLPVFLDLRYNILGASASPLIYFDMGKAFNLSDGENFKGLFLEPGIGVKIPVNNNVALNITLGFNIQKGSHYYYDPYFNDSTEKSVTWKYISFKMGVSF